MRSASEKNQFVRTGSGLPWQENDLEDLRLTMEKQTKDAVVCFWMAYCIHFEKIHFSVEQLGLCVANPLSM